MSDKLGALAKWTLITSPMYYRNVAAVFVVEMLLVDMKCLANLRIFSTIYDLDKLKRCIEHEVFPL